MTFAMRGDEEASRVKYVPKELIETWGKKDPVVNFENYLLANKIIDEELKEEVRNAIKLEIDEGLQVAFNEPELIPDTAIEVNDVYAPYTQTITMPSDATSEKRLIDAIAQAIKQAMEKHPDLILVGQDIAD